jgi:hypothetical protein
MGESKRYPMYFQVQKYRRSEKVKYVSDQLNLTIADMVVACIRPKISLTLLVDGADFLIA